MPQEQKRLDETKISEDVFALLQKHFTDCILVDFENSLFSESYLLEFEEIQHIIPAEHSYRFACSCLFMCSSGEVEFAEIADSFQGDSYIINAIADEQYEILYFVVLQELFDDGRENITILKNYLI